MAVATIEDLLLSRTTGSPAPSSAVAHELAGRGGRTVSLSLVAVPLGDILGNGVGLRGTFEGSNDREYWLALAGAPHVSIDFPDATFGPVEDGWQLGLGGFQHVRVRYELEILLPAEGVPAGGSVMVTAALAVPNPRRRVR